MARAAAVATYYPKADVLAKGLSMSDIRAAHLVMVALRKKLERENDVQEQKRLGAAST